MPNPTIAIDLDEVLSPFVADLMTWYNKTFKTDFSFDQYTTYNFAEIWGCTKEESVEICNDFHHSRDIKEIIPIPNSVEALALLKDKFDLVLVTSRPLQHLDYTNSWINHYHPNVFADVVLCNHWTSIGKAVKKSEVCKKINANYFIDDLPHYVEEVANCNIKSLIFGNYPWNQKPINHENIQRVSGWDEILKQLLK